MRTIIIAVIAGFLFAGCSKKKTADPIVGLWKLTAVYAHDTLQVSDSCTLQGTIEAADGGNGEDHGGLKERYFSSDSLGNCTEYDNDDESWYREGTGSYHVDHVSIVDQKQHITLNPGTLVYFYEAWDVDFSRTPAIITTPVKMVYGKR